MRSGSIGLGLNRTRLERTGLERARLERAGLNWTGPQSDQARLNQARSSRRVVDRWPARRARRRLQPCGRPTAICTPLRSAIRFGQPNGALRAALVGPLQRPAIRFGRQVCRPLSRCAAGARTPIFAMSRADRPLGDRIVPTAKGILWQRMRGASAPGRFSSCLR